MKAKVKTRQDVELMLKSIFREIDKHSEDEIKKTAITNSVIDHFYKNFKNLGRKKMMKQVGFEIWRETLVFTSQGTAIYRERSCIF